MSDGEGRAAARGVDRALTEARDTVRALIGMMSNGGITELDLAVGDVSIRLRGNPGPALDQAVPAAQATDAPLVVSSDGEVLTAPAIGHVITAPMIGTYYASSSPGDPPFVRVGDPVEVGQVIGIIEAMKIMNEIAADEAGVVAELFVSNAQAVEYGSPLMRLNSPDLPA